MGSVIARSPGKAYVVLLSHQLEAIRNDFIAAIQYGYRTLSQNGIDVVLPSPLRLLVDRTNFYAFGGDRAKHERCLRMIASIFKENALPNDLLSVTLRRSLEGQSDLVQQANAKSNYFDLRTLYSTVLEKPKSKNDIDSIQVAADGNNDTPPFPPHSTAEKSGTTGVASTGWSSFPAPTKEQLSTQPGTLPTLHLENILLYSR